MKMELEKKLHRELKVDADKRALEWAKSEIEKAHKEEQEKTQKDTVELDNLRKRDMEAQKEKMDFLRKAEEFENFKRDQ
jgi:molecular chaperone GrpE (heat shock protein)